MISAEAIARALGGRRSGRGWIAPCPAHDDRKPSMSIREGERVPLVHCFAGCPQDAVLDALRARGLWPERSEPHGRRSAAPAIRRTDDAADITWRIDRARRLWSSALPLPGTPAEHYLREARGIALAHWPVVLRFSPDIPHPSGARVAALVATIERDDTGLCAVYAVGITSDGQRATGLDPRKWMVGPAGGGCIRLTPAAPRLRLAEGLESALAVMAATDGAPTWAHCTLGNVERVELPQCVRAVILVPDADERRPDLADTIRARAIARWQAEGRRVSVAAIPPGCDPNDVLRAADAAALEDA